MKLRLYKSSGVRKSVIPKTPPAGTITAYAGTAAPDGWLLCNGASVSTTTYAGLFDAISTAYGGSGGSFTLPDLRGRVPRGATSVGTAGGFETISLTDSQVGDPGHSHVFSETPHSHSVTETAHQHSVVSNVVSTSTGTYATDNLDVFGASSVLTSPALSGVTMGSVSPSAAGANVTTQVSVGSNTTAATPHTNSQPSLVLSYIIKT